MAVEIYLTLSEHEYDYIMDFAVDDLLITHDNLNRVLAYIEMVQNIIEDAVDEEDLGEGFD